MAYDQVYRAFINGVAMWVVLAMLAYGLGLFDRGRLKEISQTLLIGRHIHTAELKPLAESFAEAARKFGSQCIVVAIDAKQVGPGKWEIFTHGGRNPTGLDAVDYAREVVALGAGEILLTSMDRDGTGTGFDLDLTRAVADAVPVPVIASGGVGGLDHLVAGIVEGHAAAVLAASIFHFGTHTVAEAKQHMAARGVHIRPA